MNLEMYPLCLSLTLILQYPVLVMLPNDLASCLSINVTVEMTDVLHTVFVLALT